MKLPSLCRAVVLVCMALMGLFGQAPGTSLQISGTVRTASSQPLAGVLVTLTSGQTLTTDGSGNYTAIVPPGFSGTATPSLSGYNFSPPTRTYTNLTVSQASQDYTANQAGPTTYSISGAVRTSSGQGISGVTIFFSNGGPSTSTDSNGNYIAAVSTGYSGTATPSSSGYSFSPLTRSYSNLSGNQSGQDYTGTPPVSSYSIVGVIRTSSSQGISGVAISFSNGGPVVSTDASGNYSATVPAAYNGLATPSLSGYTFTPPSRSYSNVSGSQGAQDYTGVPPTVSYSVSGSVRTPGGLGVSGATVTFSNAGPVVATDVGGNYSATVVAGYTGTATPSLAGYSFTPAVRSYTNTSANQGGQDFTGAPSASTYTIAGTIRSSSGQGISGVVIGFGNAGPNVSTDSNGSYSATVSAGYSGVAAPSLTGYSFNPASRSYSGVIANRTGEDYTGSTSSAPGSPSISSGGIVSAAGSSPGMARGSVGTIFGNSLADSAVAAATLPLPRTMGNVQVSVNGIAAPLWYVSPGQINFQVPFESPLQGQASVIVTRGNTSSGTANVALTPYAPSVFMYARVSGVYDPIIVHAADNQLITPTNPAVPGEFLIVYGTGVGDLTSLPSTGDLTPVQPLARASLLPTITIGGISANVIFAGLTPGTIGLVQFNVQVPNGLPSGISLPMVIAFGAAFSAPINLAVKTPARTPGISTVGFGPAGLALDTAGNVYAADYRANTVRRISPDGTTAVVAGNGTAGGAGDGGLAVNAQLNFPYGVAVDRANKLYISDYNNGRIRVVTPDGKIANFAGNGQYGAGGDGGPAVQAQFAVLKNVATDQSGNVYVVTALTVRRVGTDGIIRTVAGDPSCFGGGYKGDGGPAVNACLYAPEAIAIDSRGTLYIADSFNDRVRVVDPKTGIITTLAGTGIRGSSGDGGPANQAQLTPWGIAVDPSGNVYVSDLQSNSIRKVATNGTITTVVGSGVKGYAGDGGPPLAAQLSSPGSLAFDQAGNLYISDTGNGVVRKVVLP